MPSETSLPDLKDAEERLFAHVAKVDTWMGWVMHNLDKAPNHQLRGAFIDGNGKTAIMQNAMSQCVLGGFVEYFPDDFGGVSVLTPLGVQVLQGYRAKLVAGL